MSTDFQPVKVARQIIATTSLTDPEDIALAVLDRTPDSELRAAYLQVLRGAVRTAIHMENMVASTVTPVVPNRSSRVAAIRESHISYYDQRVFASGEWKMLGECTVDDVLDLAAQRREVAERNSAKAAEFEQLAARMTAAGVAVARDLEEVAA
ncbi:hypothetical protein [Glutamicibacter creatinolyticus]|uniref:hypothetical protein n=1 Tax=Glutamicibacter creatinolyticus TaxID=162496 RepID=UPI0031E267E4